MCVCVLERERERVYCVIRGQVRERERGGKNGAYFGKTSCDSIGTPLPFNESNIRVIFMSKHVTLRDT